MANNPDFNVPEGKLVTMLINGVETAYKPGVSYENAKFFVTEKFKEIPTSVTSRGIENFRAALVIDPDGINNKMSVPAAARGGKFDNSGADGIKIESTSPDFTGILVYKGKYAIRDSLFKFITGSDGKHVSDFTGYGSLLTVLMHSKVFVENCDFESVGVAKSSVYCDEGSDVVLKNCRTKVMGGKLYDGYINTADVKFMVEVPWVLGLTGNARGTNLMGNKSSMTVVNCDMKAARWGVMSTDGGKDMQLIAIDSDLTLVGDWGGAEDVRNPYLSRYGSGYGTFMLSTAEEFHGVHIRVGTFALVGGGGSAIYRSSRGHLKVTSPTTGEVLYEGEGKGRKTVIDSDAFGLTAFNGPLTVTEGTEVNCYNAIFINKGGGSVINVEDGAKLNSREGIILQMLDNDDPAVSYKLDSEYDLHFNTDFYEKEGWPSENGQITSKIGQAPHLFPIRGVNPDDLAKMMGPPRFDVRFNASDVRLKGDLYNGSGYYGQSARQLYVTLGRGCVLDGVITAAECIHVNENGEQNTHFTIKEYYYMNRVANRPFFNGDNSVEVVLTDGAVWNVTGKGFINKLTVGKNCVFNGAASIDGVVFQPGEGRTYSGLITIAPE